MSERLLNQNEIEKIQNLLQILGPDVDLHMIIDHIAQILAIPSESVRVFIENQNTLGNSNCIRTTNNTDADYYRCPITYQFMKEPVVARDGITYEKEVVKIWFKYCRRTNKTDMLTSPTSGEEIGSTLTFNQTFKNQIDDYVERHLDMLRDSDSFYLPKHWRRRCMETIVNGNLRGMMDWFQKDPRLAMVVLTHKEMERKSDESFDFDSLLAWMSTTYIVTGNERTAFHLLAENGNIEIVNYLLDFLINTLDVTLIDLMEIKENIPGTLFHPIFPFPDDYHPDVLNSELLFLCKDSSNQLDLIKQWIVFGANPRYLDAEGNTMLHVSVKSNQIDCVKWYIENYPDLILEYNKFGDTPLHLAISERNLSSVTLFTVFLGSDGLYLMQHGSGEPLLTTALSANTTGEIVNCLLNECPKLLNQPSVKKLLPLNQIIQIIVEQGNEDLTLLSIILEHKALALYDKGLQNSEFTIDEYLSFNSLVSPAHQAILLGSAPILNSLLTTEYYPISVNQRDIGTNEMYTLLQQAAVEGNDECITLLLDLGADLYLQDKQGRTALNLAKSTSKGGSHKSVIELLYSQLDPIDQKFDRIQDTIEFQQLKLEAQKNIIEAQQNKIELLIKHYATLEEEITRNKRRFEIETERINGSFFDCEMKMIERNEDLSHYIENFKREMEGEIERERNKRERKERELKGDIDRLWQRKGVYFAAGNRY